MKKRFSGKYYKFISTNGFSFALISSTSNEGPQMQLITRDGSFQIRDNNSIFISKDKITFNVAQNGLFFSGKIRMSDYHPLKKKAMGPFSIFSMECNHEIYSMYHKLYGDITYNGMLYSFYGGYGYIEGDSGKNFPEKYLWYNSVGPDYGVTLAIATIPFGFIHFTGILGFVSFKGKEYCLCTYNKAKIIINTPNYFEIAKGDYRLSVSVNGDGGHMLKAPVNGNMNRLIKENVAVETEFTFSKKGEVILSRKDAYSSLEYMF